MLLEKCVCGEVISKEMKFELTNNIPCRKCSKCGVLHQEVNLSEEEYYNFYSERYHLDYQKTLGQINYNDRYEHDCDIARQRLTKYKPYLTGKRILDVGSSNGAFVDEARKAGWDAWGVEPSKDICKIETTYGGTLIEQNFLGGEFQNITLHDVFEHLIDPVKELQEMHRILPVNGVLILDMPNYFVDCGKHHWRPIEHLWIFSEEQTCKLVNKNGFRTLAVDKPIPSKYVVYAVKS